MFQDMMMKMKAPSEMLLEILRQIHRWHDRLDPLEPVRCTSRLLQNAVTDQSYIGWGNFLFGRISTKWSEYLIAIAIPNTNHETWLVKMIHGLWDICRRAWDNRNSILHDTRNIHEFKEENLLNLFIEDQYRIGKTTLMQNTYHLLQLPIEQVLAKPVENKKIWRDAILASREQFQSPMTSNPEYIQVQES